MFNAFLSCLTVWPKRAYCVCHIHLCISSVEYYASSRINPQKIYWINEYPSWFLKNSYYFALAGCSLLSFENSLYSLDISFLLALWFENIPLLCVAGLFILLVSFPEQNFYPEKIQFTNFPLSRIMLLVLSLVSLPKPESQRFYLTFYAKSVSFFYIRALLIRPSSTLNSE